MARQSFGGSFAPPLSDEKLAQYKTLIDGVDATTELGDALRQALACVNQWWELPESSGTKSRAHASGAGTIVPLEEQHKKALWEAIPWPKQLERWGKVFDRIHPVEQKKLRDAAHHLLWHVVELSNDREPITADKL